MALGRIESVAGFMAFIKVAAALTDGALWHLMTEREEGRHGHDFFFMTSPITRCRTEVTVVASEPPTTQAAFGLIHNYVLSKCVSGRPEASITPPCLFTPFHTRFIPADGLFTVGDPWAARASHKAKQTRCSLLNKDKNKKQAKNCDGTHWCSAELHKAINPQCQVRIVIHSFREGFFFCPLMLGLRCVQEGELTHTYALAA